MALLIVNLDKQIGNAQAWRDNFADQLSDLEIRIWPDAGAVADIEYLAFIRPDFDVLPRLPNLKAMFSRSAGVEAFVNHPKLPKVPLGKVEPSGGDPMMTEYVVMHVLRFHRDMPGYQAAQAAREWRRTTIVRPEQRRIGFLGYGMMAKAPALVLQSLGFPVSAWVRSPREAAEVPIFHGPDQLERFLNRHRGLPVAADPGNRGDFLRPHLCDDAQGSDAGECRARRARRGRRSDPCARFGTIVLCRLGRVASRALAAGKPALAPPQSHRDAPRGAASDGLSTRNRDGRKHPQHRGRRPAVAGNRHDPGVLIEHFGLGRELTS
jgi:hypothetical protein